MYPPFVYAGVDVSKAILMVFVPGFGSWQFNNTEKGIRKFLKKACQIPGLAVCCEASGGYELALTDACLDKGIPVSVVPPHRVRYWAKGKGILAKTDKIDARLISDYAAQNEIRFLEKPGYDWKSLRELTRERQYQVNRRKDLQNHMSLKKDKELRRMNRSEIRATEKRIQKLEQRIQEFIDAEESLQELVGRLTVVKGIAWVTATTVVAEFPYLDQLGPQAASALAGVAPFNCDSGKFKGHRKTQGGNARVRTALYMAAMSASSCNHVLKGFYRRLLLKGKEKKLALIALARKLIRLMARIAADPTFQPTEGEEVSVENSPFQRGSLAPRKGKSAVARKAVQDVRSTPRSGPRSLTASAAKALRTLH